MARYYHSLGSIFLAKSGARASSSSSPDCIFAYDGAKTPVRNLMTEIADAVKPRIFITTGTGGGIGKDVALGDVVIAGRARFDCVTQFKNQPWKAEGRPTSPLIRVLQAITPDLTRVNAARTRARGPPENLGHGRRYHRHDRLLRLRQLDRPLCAARFRARACDMGDAMVGYAMQGVAGIRWYAVRNASDPQIPNPTGNIDDAKQQAGQIYAEYGAFTTAASVIASWAIIDKTFNGGN